VRDVGISHLAHSYIKGGCTVNKKLVSWFCVIMLAVLSACAYQQEDLVVQVIADGNALKITAYTGEGTEVNIPSRIRNLPVTVIGDWAFRENKLTNVVIPNSVTHIGEGAFAANNLASIKIPNSVTYIGIGAFAGNQIANAQIPNSVTHIGYAAFADNQLTDIVIPGSVTHIKERVFFRNQLTRVSIPDSVTHIGTWAFLENRLIMITIPYVTYIGVDAFDRAVTVTRTQNTQ